MPESFLTMLSNLAAKPRGPGDPLVDPPTLPGPPWMKAIAILWFTNFIAFTTIAMYLGGDAINGYVKDGHYFLSMHGGAVEVSRDVFTYSRWHAIVTIASFVIVMPLSIAMKRRAAR